jgi:tetratricopeptide (TPR) repeat protein
LEDTLEIQTLTTDALVETHAPLNSALAAPPPPVVLDLEELYMILQIEPNDSIIALELARRLNELDRAPEALKILRNVVDIDFRFDTLNALGQTEYTLEMLDDAFDHLQAAVMVAGSQEPRLFDVFKTLGNIFVRRGDFMSAEDNYLKAHRINAASDVLWVNLGTLAVQRSEWDQAARHFQTALNMNNANDRAWTGLAIAHRMKGDLELATANLEAALQYDPMNETALTLILDWGLAEHRETRVLDLLRGFLVAGGWSERLSLAFAYLSARRGDRFLAECELERLLAVNPQHEAAATLLRELRVG